MRVPRPPRKALLHFSQGLEVPFRNGGDLYLVPEPNAPLLRVWKKNLYFIAFWVRVGRRATAIACPCATSDDVLRESAFRGGSDRYDKTPGNSDPRPTRPGTATRQHRRQHITSPSQVNSRRHSPHSPSSTERHTHRSQPTPMLGPNSTWWSRPPDTAHDASALASARTTWGWATGQHLYMTPALARPRRAWPSPPAPVAACAGATECTLTATAQHGAFHRFPWALCWACPGATPQRQSGQTRTLGTRAVSKDALRVTNPS